jgi:hypothetical protein
VIEFACDAAALADAGDLDLVLEFLGRDAADTQRAQHCTITLNGLAIAYVEAPETATTYTLRLPPQIRTSGSRMRLTLMMDHAELVYDDKGHILDNRRLSLQLRRFGLFSSKRTDLTVLSPGQNCEASIRGGALPCLVEGFSEPEGPGSWILGRRATLRFRLANPNVHGSLALHLVGRKARAGSPQKVRASINGVALPVQELPDAVSAIDLPITERTVDFDGVCNVTLEFDHAEPSFDDDGEIQDRRFLAAMLVAIEVRAPVESEGAPLCVPALAVGALHETRTGRDALTCLGRGFSRPEETGTWIDGTKATIHFRQLSPSPDVTLVLHMVGRNSRFGMIQHVSVSVNGVQTPPVALPARVSAIDVPLTEAMAGPDGEYCVMLDFAHDDPVTDSDGKIVDPRRLSAMLVAIELCPPAAPSAPPTDQVLTPQTPPARTLARRIWARLRALV